MKKFLSIDIGGTKILCVEFTKSLEIIKEIRLDTTILFKHKNLNDLKNLFVLIANEFGGSRYEKLGVSINCAIMNNRIIYSSLINGGNGVDISSIANKYLNYKSFDSDNDVICMAKAEKLYGYGKKHNSLVYINLGTGIRVVAIENGIILRGSSNMAGEISPMDIWSYEKKQFETADNLLAGKGLKSLSIYKTGKILPPEEIFDGKHNDIVIMYVNYLSNFIVNLSYFYNPELFVFGGSVTKSAESWLPQVTKNYSKKLPKFMQAREFKITTINHPASIGALI